MMFPIVALRKESVDRNCQRYSFGHFGRVALRKESVDRNLSCNYPFELFKCRSPQGERG